MRNTTRRAAAAAAVVVTIACVAVTACADGSSTLTAGPSMTSPRRETGPGPDLSATPASVVLARTAQQPIRSGRVDVHAGSVQMTAVFDGDDLAIRTGATPGPDATEQAPAGFEMLLVGGRAYAHTGDTYLRVPFGSQALSSSLGTRISDTISAVRRLLEKATVDDPGTPTQVDGIAVTRYRASLTGTGVADLLGGTGAWRSEVPGDDATRRSIDDAMNRAKVTILGDIDAQGVLRHLVITVSPDPAATADCGLVPTVTITLGGIDQPQGITAPPASQVKDLTELDPSQLLGDVARGFHIDGGSAPGATAPTTSVVGDGSDCPR